MRYYSIKRSLSKKVIGNCFTQTIGVPDGYTDKQIRIMPNYIGNLNNKCFPNFQPFLYFQNDPKAKLTDVISIGGLEANGLFISKRFKLLLSEYNLNNYKFYEGKLYWNSELLEYFWFHPVLAGNEFDYIDFQSSIFLVNNPKSGILENIKLTNSNTIIQLNAEFKYIGISELHLSKERFPNLDLFYIPGLNFRTPSFFASEKLINKMQIDKITGLEINEKTEDGGIVIF